VVKTQERAAAAALAKQLRKEGKTPPPENKKDEMHKPMYASPALQRYKLQDD